MAAISRMRCRANEEGLPRLGVGSVFNSEFSGCVGSIFKSRGLGLLVFGIWAGAGGRVFTSGSGPGSWDCAGVDDADGVSTRCSSFAAVFVAGCRLKLGSFKFTSGDEEGREGDGEVRKSRLLQSFIFVLSPSSDRSSRSTL